MGFWRKPRAGRNFFPVAKSFVLMIRHTTGTGGVLVVGSRSWLVPADPTRGEGCSEVLTPPPATASQERVGPRPGVLRLGGAPAPPPHPGRGSLWDGVPMRGLYPQSGVSANGATTSRPERTQRRKHPPHPPWPSSLFPPQSPRHPPPPVRSVPYRARIPAAGGPPTAHRHGHRAARPLHGARLLRRSGAPLGTLGPV